MTINEVCTHQRLKFGSGDYYLFCQDCPAYWCQHRHTIPEYELRANGKVRVGADPSVSKMPTVSGSERVAR